MIMKKSIEGSECPDLEYQAQTTPHNDRTKNKATSQKSEDEGEKESSIEESKP